MKILDEVISAVKERGTKTIPGETLFKLYDTYGFPLDITAEIARENELVLDEAGFRNAMDTQRERARRAWVGEEKIKPIYHSLKSLVATEFVGYEHIESRGKVAAIIKDGVNVERADSELKLKSYLIRPRSTASQEDRSVIKELV